jgi:hypothetical protein
MLVEETRKRGHLVEFFPKFHCELNWIEYYWGSSKRYARDNCEYNLESLRKTIPLALASVPDSTIHAFYHKCMRQIQAYRAGVQFGTPEFVDYTKKYKSHRRIYFMAEDI